MTFIVRPGEVRPLTENVFSYFSCTISAPRWLAFCALHFHTKPRGTWICVLLMRIYLLTRSRTQGPSPSLPHAATRVAIPIPIPIPTPIPSAIRIQIPTSCHKNIAMAMADKFISFGRRRFFFPPFVLFIFAMCRTLPCILKCSKTHSQQPHTPHTRLPGHLLLHIHY